MRGPLTGIRVIEFAGLGPGPFCGMMLADQGAEVIRIDRPGAHSPPHDALARNRRSMVLDMKQPDALTVARKLCASADAIIEGYRPGVMERMGLGPDVLIGDNPKLVYGRMTGWGQYGPYAASAGHDINYIALSGVLHTIGRAGEGPTVPMNYIGDFGGGGMMLAFGIVSALLAVRSGTATGQVIDCAMTDGSALLAAMTWSFYNMGMHRDDPGTNMLDGGAHYYDCYRCADGKYISIGSIEPQFYALLREKADLADADFDAQHDRATWPQKKEKLAAIIAQKTCDEWCALMEMTDVCFAPVLSLAEAPQHPHNVARQTFVEVAGALQPAPAPRFSGTPSAPPAPPPALGADGDILLAALGYTAADIAALREKGVFGK